ncbi:viperin family antiviral radical SAM protein [Ancylomarina longa]|uniref:S-adenosylmethionine-dependent nucleotide dehydratase n=1 Tax=Ancylomarina longa TaxID=2487017 RepID=A0A434AF21_9BACT|nr:viperin family antiviral radical SAM protein [Ancylomarina longa]RUT72938.1 radical SAM protein [Ancylomarina longa]
MKNNLLAVSQIPSVNFHLWEPCNMKCKFCFASFQDVKQTILPKGHLSQNEALEVVRQLAEAGFEKITFAGGEPTLCPWLSDLIQLAKDLEMTTMLVTNGSRLSDQFLKNNRKSLDWIAISIDSLNSSTNSTIGRRIAGRKSLSADHYISIVEKIKLYGYGLKINTVVNKYNCQEDMSDFIQRTDPKRWKVLQVLPIKGQNDNWIDDMVISKEEFQCFIDNHRGFKSMVPEDNEAMIGSYVMVDLAGRFFDDVNGFHTYSQPILKLGVGEAIKEVNYDFEKFILRKGVYEW